MNQHRGEHPLNPDLPPSVTQNRNAAPAGGRSPVDFDLAEALRLRALGWSYRRIARQMNTVSRETVRTRVRDCEAQFRVATPEPVQQPPVPVRQQAPVADYKAPMAPPAAPRPDPVPVVAPLEPDGLDTIPPGCKAFFLVRGGLNQQYAHGYAQPSIGIETWHHAYASLPAFQAAERIWVVVTANEENRGFILSLLADITIRERCVISTLGVQTVCKFRMLRERSRQSAPFVDPAFQLADRSAFERAHGFQPMPQPNHVHEIDELLKPAHQPDVPAAVGGMMSYGCPPTRAVDDDPPAARGDRSCGFSF